MTQMVIDVSYHNGTINWETFAKTGMHTIIRCGYGDNYASQDDKKYFENIEACERLGIPHGVYFYSYATNENHLSSEIEHCLRLINGRELQYPVYFDAEQPGTQNFSCTAANEFCEAVERAGFWAGVYASDSWFKSYMHDLGNYTKWVARYGNYAPVTQCDMWQFTSKAIINGVPTADGGVDCSYCYRNFPAEIIGRELQKEVMKMGPWFAFAYKGGTFIYMDGKAICMPCPEDYERIQQVYREQSNGKEIPKTAISEALCKVLIGGEQ